MGKLNLNFLHLADGASVDNLGKISIYGIFERIFLTKIPGRFLKFSVVGNITLPEKDADLVEVEIRIVDPGSNVMKISPPIKIEFNITEKLKNDKLNFLVDIGNLEFKDFGKYRIWVYVNGKKIGEKEFMVEERSDLNV